MSDEAIKSCRCDLCHKQEVGIEYYQHGTPVLFVCRVCQPREVAAAASRVVFNAVVAALFSAAT